MTGKRDCIYTSVYCATEGNNRFLISFSFFSITVGDTLSLCETNLMAKRTESVFVRQTRVYSLWSVRAHGPPAPKCNWRFCRFGMSVNAFGISSTTISSTRYDIFCSQLFGVIGAKGIQSCRSQRKTRFQKEKNRNVRETTEESSPIMLFKYNTYYYHLSSDRR